MQDAICFERGEITAHIEDDKIIYKGDTFEIPPTLVSVFKEGRAKLVAGDLVVHDTKIYSAASGETGTQEELHCGRDFGKH
ncbi:MAG: hypothetical protein U5N86_07960 [Planctomycetota bacterium]|nr:hypothetical protein [Planctomycetota bacterium]